MSKSTTISVLVLAFVVLGGIIFAMSSFISSSSLYSAKGNLSTANQANTISANTTGAQNQGTTANSSNTTASALKFSEQPYYKFAYEIDVNNLGNLTSATKQALSGFNVTSKSNADGTVTVTLTPTNPEYSLQSYIVKPNQKLYFIERSLGDDGNGQDGFLADDTAVVVDQNGNVVQ